MYETASLTGSDFAAAHLGEHYNNITEDVKHFHLRECVNQSATD